MSLPRSFETMVVMVKCTTNHAVKSKGSFSAKLFATATGETVGAFVVIDGCVLHW